MESMKEGDVVTQVRGIVTTIRAKEETNRRGATVRRGARIEVRTIPLRDDDDREDELTFEVPEENVSRLRIGQEVAVEIRVLK